MWSEKMGIANVQLLEGVEPPYLFRKDLCKYTIVSMFQFFDIVQKFPSVSEPYSTQYPNNRVLPSTRLREASTQYF